MLAGVADGRTRTPSLYLIYRRRNAHLVADIIWPAIDARWDVSLWALDACAPLLADFTIGEGKGSKFELMNELLRAPRRQGAISVFSDDDYVFRRGDVVRFVGLMERTALDIAQPAQHTARNAFHAVTVRRPAHIARLTGFVEIGPLFAFSPRASAAALPFPEDAGMGWGLEFEWAKLAADGVTLGVIDGVSLDHLAPPGSAYDGGAAYNEMVARLAARGMTVPEWRGATAASWRVHRSRPPASWTAAAPVAPPFD
jgi:hypothetical protein